MGDRPQLFPAPRLLQPDLLGARCAGRHPERPSAGSAEHRAHRRRDLSLRREHAAARSGQLLRGQVLAAMRPPRWFSAAPPATTPSPTRPPAIPRSRPSAGRSTFARIPRSTHTCPDSSRRASRSRSPMAARKPGCERAPAAISRIRMKKARSERSSASWRASCSVSPGSRGSRHSWTGSTISRGSAISSSRSGTTEGRMLFVRMGKAASSLSHAIASNLAILRITGSNQVPARDVQHPADSP